MEFKDITTWTVTPDHKARPKNPYSQQWFDFNKQREDLKSSYSKFEAFAAQYTYHCSPSLVAGEYPAADVELVFQVRYWDTNKQAFYNWQTTTEAFVKSITNSMDETRQYLQLKQPVKEQEVIHLDINDFAISESDLERAFCFGYLANPENNPLDTTEMMRRYEVFKTQYLLPMLSRKGIIY